MPVIGPLDDRQRALAFSFVTQAAEGKVFDDAAMDRLIEELRQRFPGERPCR